VSWWKKHSKATIKFQRISIILSQKQECAIPIFFLLIAASEFLASLHEVAVPVPQSHRSVHFDILAWQQQARRIQIER
jgi:hypothetical protein